MDGRVTVPRETATRGLGALALTLFLFAPWLGQATVVSLVRAEAWELWGLSEQAGVTLGGNLNTPGDVILAVLNRCALGCLVFAAVGPLVLLVAPRRRMPALAPAAASLALGGVASYVLALTVVPNGITSRERSWLPPVALPLSWSPFTLLGPEIHVLPSALVFAPLVAAVVLALGLAARRRGMRPAAVAFGLLAAVLAFAPAQDVYARQPCFGAWVFYQVELAWGARVTCLALALAVLIEPVPAPRRPLTVGRHAGPPAPPR